MIISCLGKVWKNLKIGGGRGIFRLCAASLCPAWNTVMMAEPRSHFESTRMRGIPGEWQRRKVRCLSLDDFVETLPSPGLTGPLQMIFKTSKTRVLFSLARVCKLSAHPQHDFPRKNWSKFKKINV